MERLVREYGVHEQQIGVILEEGYDELFEGLAKEFGEARTAASMISNVFPELERQGHRIDTIPVQTFRDLFIFLRDGTFTREALPEVLRTVLTEGTTVEAALRKLGLEAASKQDVDAIVRDVVEERLEFVREKGEDAVGPLMGVVMQRLRGRADGKLVSEILAEMIEEIVGGGK